MCKEEADETLVGTAFTGMHASMHTQMNEQPENIVPPVLATRWMDA